MAVFHPHRVSCVCGNTVVAELADSVNVTRAPSMRERILRGELHRAACPACHRQMTVEKPFYYTDLLRSSFFKVLPRGERHRFAKASQEIEHAADYFGAEVGHIGQKTLRVV